MIRAGFAGVLLWGLTVAASPAFAEEPLPQQRGEAFVKQSVSLDVNLWPNWTLESDFAIRHDTQSGGGKETAESSIELRRRF